MREAELHVPPDVQYVGLARLLVTFAARKAGMNDERIEDLKIAVSEATTNAINAHRRNGHENDVVVSFGAEESAFVVTVTDSGPGFDPADANGHPADAADDQGLGVMLIRDLADTVEFTRDDGMRVQMRFEIGLTSSG